MLSGFKALIKPFLEEKPRFLNVLVSVATVALAALCGPLWFKKKVLLDNRQAFKSMLTVLFRCFEDLWGSKNGY
jgi:hypothetical protein